MACPKVHSGQPRVTVTMRARTPMTCGSNVVGHKRSRLNICAFEWLTVRHVPVFGTAGWASQPQSVMHCGVQPPTGWLPQAAKRESEECS